MLSQHTGFYKSHPFYSASHQTSHFNLKILKPRGNRAYIEVSELISPITGCWDEQLIRSLFWTVDVNRILQIPLNTHGFDNFIAWSGTTHDKYSVRSGYHMQWRHQYGMRGGQLALPGSSIYNPVWRVFWKLKIPSKVKIFVWRALHDGIIPLKFILTNRHIGTSGQCTIRNQAAEEVLHLFFNCPAAQTM